MDQRVSQAWIASAVAEYSAAHDREAMPWMMQAGFDSGSFASLLGVSYLVDEAAANVFVLGDSLVVLVDGTALRESYPYRDPEEFDECPILLSTRMSANSLLTDDDLVSRFLRLDLTELREPALLMMTDALGRWLLEHRGDGGLLQLLELTDQERFGAFVGTERATGKLRRDDTTLIVMACSDDLPTDHRL